MRFSRLALVLFVFGCAEAPAPPPFGPTPSARQLAWHDLEYYAFVHFGPNTFTDVEWGHGDERPEVFNPEQFDAGQWVRTFRDAGMQGIIITAKHHDGFALWPSEYSTHTVRESTWKDGKGDVLRELSEACRQYGLKFGVYISPWDRNHPQYGTPEYNDVFKAMLEEVLTNYGEVFEVWFDGANGEGPNGRKQEYDFEGFAQVVRRLQPGAVIFSDAGPDIRWVGNEQGYAGETNWSTIRGGAFYPGIPGVNDQLEQGHTDGDTWLPAEVDVSIRPGWFYHSSQDGEVKSLSRLSDIWFESVGRNANLLLNIPVDPRGLVHENDAARLRAFRAWRDEAFGRDLASDASLDASEVRGLGFGPELVVDGDNETYWATSDGVTEASLTVEFPRPTAFNSVRMREPIRLGQRISSFVLEVETPSGWQEVSRGTTVGNRRMVRFEGATSDRLRLGITARAPILISDLSVFDVPPVK